MPKETAICPDCPQKCAHCATLGYNRVLRTLRPKRIVADQPPPPPPAPPQVFEKSPLPFELYLKPQKIVSYMSQLSINHMCLTVFCFAARSSAPSVPFVGQPASLTCKQHSLCVAAS